MTIKLYFDGASKGNPGKAGCGFVVYYDNASPYEGYKFLGHATNNEAEYHALIYGLKTISDFDKDLEIYGDSNLVIMQMQDKWKINAPNLIPLHDEAKILISKFENVTFTHIPRVKNKTADMLANLAISSE